MKQWPATITARRMVRPALWQIQVTAPEMPEKTCPGQFFLAESPGYLRHPLFPTRLGSQDLAFMVKAGPDPFVAWMASRAPGDTLDLIGPLGQGFEMPAKEQRLLLVAEWAPDVGPLLPLIEPALAAGAPITLLTGALQSSDVFPASELPTAVELRVTTADGSLGQRGNVTALLPDVLGWADRVCATGSRTLYRALRTGIDSRQALQPRNFAQVLLHDITLACGVGACIACAVEGERGPRLACIEGPVFDLRDLEGELAP